jgi:UDP-3-O-[3-hydroxymyristoyl] glucosamine N-acyltransferase
MPADARELTDYLNHLNRLPTWEEASRFGVELVDAGAELDDDSRDVLHLADGPVMRHGTGVWSVDEQARQGVVIRSGDWTRVHNSGVQDGVRIHPTAHVDRTARIEAGVSIGPHAHIGAHAHIGRDAMLFRYAWIGDGAFVGTGTKLRGAAIVGNGAIVGAGSDIGQCTRLAAGTVVEQGASLESHSATASNQRVPRRGGIGRHASHVAHAVERLATMNRAD